jgi:hypothetical protein
MAGNAKNNPPTVGPNFLAIIPANTVMLPQIRNRPVYSYHFDFFNADGVILTFKVSLLTRLAKSSGTDRPDYPWGFYHFSSFDFHDSLARCCRTGFFPIRSFAGLLGEKSVGDPRAHCRPQVARILHVSIAPN